MHTHQIMGEVQPVTRILPGHCLALAGTEVKAVSPNEDT